jgi:hypothetical protein
MNYSKSGEFDVVTRITGPHHHYLALQMQTDAEPSYVAVECYLADGLIGPAEPTRESEIRSEVSSGIDAANLRLATRFRASRIRFVASDPPLKGVYRIMSEGLVEHLGHVSGHVAGTVVNRDLLNAVEISS